MPNQLKYLAAFVAGISITMAVVFLTGGYSSGPSVLVEEVGLKWRIERQQRIEKIKELEARVTELETVEIHDSTKINSDKLPEELAKELRINRLQQGTEVSRHKQLESNHLATIDSLKTKRSEAELADLKDDVARYRQFCFWMASARLNADHQKAVQELVEWLPDIRIAVRRSTLPDSQVLQVTVLYWDYLDTYKGNYKIIGELPRTHIFVSRNRQQVEHFSLPYEQASKVDLAETESGLIALTLNQQTIRIGAEGRVD